MKKEIMVCMLIVLLAVSCVFALEKTRLYGEVDPNGRVRLYLSYYANNKYYENQLVTKVADEFGKWEYKVGSDVGKVDIKMIYVGVEKEYTATVGEELEIDFLEKKVVEENETEENETFEEVEEVIEEEEEKEGGALTGSVVSEDDTENKTIGFFKEYIYYIIGGLVLVGVILFFVFRGVNSRPRQNINVRRLSEIKRGEKISNGAISNAEKKIEEAQAELTKLKKLEEARKKLEEDQKDLERLERGL